MKMVDSINHLSQFLQKERSKSGALADENFALKLQHRELEITIERILANENELKTHIPSENKTEHNNTQETAENKSIIDYKIEQNRTEKSRT